MGYVIDNYCVVKNEKSEYYTGDWRSEDQWSSVLKNAKRYKSQEELLLDIINDRRLIQDNEGFNIFEYGIYSIEFKIEVKEC